MAIMGLVSLVIPEGRTETTLALLKKASALVSSIRIPYIADLLRENIAKYYLDYSELLGIEDSEKMVLRLVRSIGDYDLKKRVLSRMGRDVPLPAGFRGIMKMAGSPAAQDGNPSTVASVEEKIRSITDRRERTERFSDIGIIFWQDGSRALSEIMLEDAMKEAGGIRPLSDRSCTLCSIAMKMYVSGCEQRAQEFLDSAIDAATDIRQPDLREELFGELNCAIRIIQGGV
jgi:hypothetical protein